MSLIHELGSLVRRCGVPLVRVSLLRGTSKEFRTAISDGVHRAMVETINVPALDRFQVITEHDKGDLVYDPSYLDIARSDGVVLYRSL